MALTEIGLGCAPIAGLYGKQLTQEELAHRTGLSTRHIGAIERAEMSATLTVVGLIAEVLGVEPAELVTK
jgi:transcriptional regulator with XRE-family HTH domain